MFSKRQPKLETIIGPESTLKGDLVSKGTVKIDGHVEGNVAADCLVIGETGNLAGDATVREIVIGGRLIGSIHATDGVDIQSKGEVCGDIFSARLTITEGGRFDGRSTMQLQKKIPYTGEASL
ncbi:MAG: polymer-forming cytoskeletal protein [Desulfuromonadales bacterium]